MFSYKINPWRRDSVIKKLGNDAVRNEQEVQRLLQEIEADFQDESFFFAAHLIGAVAQV